MKILSRDRNEAGNRGGEHFQRGGAGKVIGRPKRSEEKVKKSRRGGVKLFSPDFLRFEILLKNVSIKNS